MESAYINVNNIHLHYVTEGSEDTSPFRKAGLLDRMSFLTSNSITKSSH